MHTTPSLKEDHISQVPALQLLVNLGYEYLTPGEALSLRGGKENNVILDGVLVPQLRKMNTIHFKGMEYPFTEGNILAAVQALKAFPFDGLIRTNEQIFDLLCLGKSFPQAIDGDVKSYTLQYIDWKQPENNVYHVTEEFSVERTGRLDTYRPDIILFVNGIPLSVIECKRPDLKAGEDPIDQAISQHIRNQKDEGIPQLFLYSQLLLAISKNEAKYATTGTQKKFWAVWKEDDSEDSIHKIINQPLTVEQKDKLFLSRPVYERSFFDSLEAEGGREVTGQDRAIFNLCRPERLLELTYRFILFDNAEKKIARYQQYFTVKNIMERITTFNREGKRNGGVVWHTQGSGKSLTMVMLAKSIALEPTIENHKIILVTDRVDLDDQIYKTFYQCGKEPEQAKTGKHLVELLMSHKERIITTVIDKFEAAVANKELKNNDTNVFVLVDESHRSQYSTLNAKMEKTLPRACYIGFTGTPLMKKQKNTIAKFGGLIKPTYTIRQAVEDKSVVPLLYEGRHIQQKVDAEEIDKWFEITTRPLTQEQKEDLKKKIATTDQLNKAEQKIKLTAFDIGLHFTENWKGTEFKAQLVTQDKQTAIKYKRYLKEFGAVTSEVLISGPDTREGEDDIYSDSTDEIKEFWKSMMDKYGTEEKYNKQLINAFKHDEEPEIIIVVDKLLTGFDAPRNTIMYLTRKLKEHTLLQAIARVNRLHEGKDYGYILDYRGVLSELDQALDLYDSLSEFDKEDIADTLTDVSMIIQNLPQKYSDLWEIFKGIKNKQDDEAFQRLLADEVLRVKFYERFTEFARHLGIALSSVKFLEATPEDRIDKFKNDLKYFKGLRTSVRRRYAEVIDFSEYEPKIQKLIDTHVGTKGIEQITPEVNIFDTEKFAEEVAKIEGDAAKADTIAHRTIRTIEERMQEDPTFYRKFSELLREVIEEFRQERINETEYLFKVTKIQDSVVTRTGDHTPEALKNKDIAKAFYGSIREVLNRYDDSGIEKEQLGSEISLRIEEIIQSKRIVNWQTNMDIQNQMRNEIEDYFFKLKNQFGFEMSFDDIDLIMDKCIAIAKVRI